MKDIFLFGAGIIGEETFKILEDEGYYNILAFVDNDPNKAGKTLHEKKIVSADYIKNYKDIPVIIAVSPQYNDEITKQLDELGIKSYVFEEHIYIANNLIITEKNIEEIKKENNNYAGNLYFTLDDINKTISLEKIDNIIVDSFCSLDYIYSQLKKLNVSKLDKRLSYIEGSNNLKSLRREIPYMMKNGINNFFPVSEATFLYCFLGLNIDIETCRKIKNKIFSASAKKELIDPSYNITNYYKSKYMLWEETNYQSEFDSLIEEKIKYIDESNGSRFYNKFNINLGIICDEFLYVLYKDLCNVFFITPENYRDYAEKVDVLMVVTVWRGLNKEWFMPIDKKLKTIREITKFYKEKNSNIKTVFYSKEDPVHYDEFVEFAFGFDYVFTTDINCLPKYISDLKNENVFNVNFAVNPLYHNPIGINRFNIDSVIFSGSWYRKYEERNRILKEIFDGIIENYKSLYIVDRNFNEDCRIFFPLEYLILVLKCIKHDKLQKVHKLFNYAVNINTIQNSSTMFANRVYELQAQGNILISNYSKGVSEKFKNVFIVNKKDDLNVFFNKYNNMKDIIEAQSIGIRNVMTENTAHDRMKEILTYLDLPFKESNNKVLVIVKQRNELSDKIIEEQTYKNTDIISEDQLNDKLISEYRFICYINSQYNYNKYYIQDMLNAFKYTDVDFVTKNCSEYQNNYTYIDMYTDKYLTMFSTKNLDSFKLIDISNNKFKGFYIP